MAERQALVLTGELSPGYDATLVWPALAGYFRMEPEKLSGQLLARAPVTIKESEDLAKLQNLQAGIHAIGAQAELHPAGEGALFALVDNRPRGPVPRAFIAERVRLGYWPGDVPIAPVGSSTWTAFSATQPAYAAPFPAAAEPAYGAAAAAAAEAPAAFATAPVAAVAPGDLLPGGLAIHAGFWRRTAAYVMDGFLLAVVGWVVALVLGIGMLGALAGGSLDGALGAMMLQWVSGIVLAWLYFALQESSAAQATLGKRAMGLKVTDDYGRRIGFGRATGRFFGKILSGLILYIGFMLAGWTDRRQGLHDMICGTLVVFRAVEPGQPLPTTRPPMPWYGWVINILTVLLLCLSVFGLIAGIGMLGAQLGNY